MGLNEKLTAIADKIREYGDIDNSLTLDDMANSIPNIHERGYAEGNISGFVDGEAVGVAHGITEGRKAERDAFWGMYLSNGTRADYVRAFTTFTDEWFDPKYDIIPTNANQMFNDCKITNLKKLIDDAGIVFDTSNAKYLAQIVAGSTITHVPIINCTAATAISSAFANAKSLVYIEKLIVSANNTYATAFSNVPSLVEVRFEGTIASDMNLQWSPLSVESMKSIISCLSTSVSGKTITFNDSCWAALEASGTSPSGGTWVDYVNDLGWIT